nr:MAG TPA: hypothetical protein [Caudoviricetes sp.]
MGRYFYKHRPYLFPMKRLMLQMQLLFQANFCRWPMVLSVTKKNRYYMAGVTSEGLDTYYYQLNLQRP